MALEEVASMLSLDAAAIRTVADRYPFRLNAYYLRLALEGGEPLLRQVIPDQAEISSTSQGLPEDPLREDSLSPVPNLTHRYADRVLFLVSESCPILCRFCTRKRKVGRALRVTRETIDGGIAYIAAHPEIRDVLLSGGDPLMLGRDRLKYVLAGLRGIPSVQVIRVGTRVPCAMPRRVTSSLAALLAEHAPVYVHTHFNHPLELTPEARAACASLADAGIPLNNQTVLLRGINDDPDTLEELFRLLLVSRVQPYYLFQMDTVRGTDHFRTPLSKGLDIMDELRRRTSEMALPTFAVDLPDGRGKVVPSRGNAVMEEDGSWTLFTPEGERVRYRD